MTDPQPAASRDTRGRFEPGASGNPAGKKPGTLNRATILKQALDEGDFDTAMQSFRTALQAGNFTAARLVIDRLDPKPRNRPIPLEIPDDLPIAERFTFVSRAMFRGEISPDEAKVMVAVLEAEDAAYQRVADREAAARQRLATRSTNALVMEMYRDQLEARLKTKLPPFPFSMDLFHELMPDVDLHAACNLDEAADAAAVDPSPASGGGEGEGQAAPDLHSPCKSSDTPSPDPVIPGLDPGIITAADGAAAAPPVMMAGCETDGSEAAASGLHPACIPPHDADPASVLPTRRRRAVNRLRAEAAQRAATQRAGGSQ